jgi:hypothetical protein
MQALMLVPGAKEDIFRNMPHYMVRPYRRILAAEEQKERIVPEPPGVMAPAEA